MSLSEKAQSLQAMVTAISLSLGENCTLKMSRRVAGSNMPAVNNSARLLYLSATPALSTFVADIIPEVFNRSPDRAERGGDKPWARKGVNKKPSPRF